MAHSPYALVLQHPSFVVIVIVRLCLFYQNVELGENLSSELLKTHTKPLVPLFSSVWAVGLVSMPLGDLASTDSAIPSAF